MRNSTMGDVLKCPLCCDKTFESKLSLLQHLTGLLSNINCPVCDNKWSSITHLIEHLSLDNCRRDSSTQSFDVQTSENSQNDTDIKPFISSNQTLGNENQKDLFPQLANKETVESIGSNNGDKTYTVILGKHVTKTHPQPQEIKFIEDNGQSQYVFMDEMDSDLDSDNVVTKQNNDGTISMTTVRDLKTDTDSTMVPSQDVLEDNRGELYSCNSCGVSFSSVIEHIQNYHNDQEVVVEEPVDDVYNEVPIEHDPMMTEGSLNNTNFTPRRMITETGDIVEAPITMKSTVISDKIKEEKPARGPAKRYVQVEKFCDSIIKDIKPRKDKDEPFHRAVVKDMETTNGTKVKMYQCIVCNVYVTALSDLKLQPCKALKYPCPHCPVAYENSKSLCAHMKIHKVPKVKCPHCDLIYDNAKALCEHAKIHEGQKSAEATYNCEVCCTVFLTNKSLKLHKRMHDPVKTRPIDPPVKCQQDGTTDETMEDERYLCNVCHKMIPIDYRTIHQHSHKTDNNMNCTVCNKKFQSEEYLEMHMRAHNMHKTRRCFHRFVYRTIHQHSHKTDNNMNCTVCNKKFQSEEYLEMHMRAHNMHKVPENKTDKSLPYSCVYCPRQFSRPHEKVKHERIHTGEKPHSCEICGKSFRVSYCLTLHMRTHTGARPYACPHCGKRFKAHSVYNHHLLTHSEKRAYKCPMCPKAFKTSVQLAGHKKCHTKPFSCQHCNRPFASLYAVRVHMETHGRQNNLKFTCPLCGARYARAFALKDHVKQAHQLDGDSLEKLQPDGDKDWVVLDEGANTETIQIEVDSIKSAIGEVDIPTSKDNSLITILDMNAEEMIVP